MKPFQERVIDEKEQLDKKIGALALWLSNDSNFKGIGDEDVGLLRTQHSVMLALRTILKMRISRFYDETDNP